jgi:peptide deformylase
VTVAFIDETAVEAEREFEGLWSTSVQHQIDHLNGQMYFDRLSRLKREMLLKRAQKVAP